MSYKTQRASRNLSDADCTAASNLRAKFQAAKANGDMARQADLAAAYGATEAAISQYLNGRQRIGDLATLRFSQIFKCSPSDIRPDFTFAGVGPELPANAVEVATLWLSLPAAVRDDFHRTLVTLSQTRYEMFIDRAKSANKRKSEREKTRKERKKTTA